MGKPSISCPVIKNGGPPDDWYYTVQGLNLCSCALVLLKLE